MDSIAGIARICFNRFRELTTALTLGSEENRESMPLEALEWEFSRFKIWCGNLGVLQTGSSSLDSRLRESTVVRTNVFEHLVRLDRALLKSKEVASGSRLPLEKQPQPEDSSSDSSSEESESDDELSKELVLHMESIKKILSDLYMLSFRIRNNSTRPTSNLRVKLYKELDETGADKFAAYTEFDKRYIEDLLLQLRRDAAIEMGKAPSEFSRIMDTDQYLIDRLVVTMNIRRKFLRYWQRHAKKLAEVPKEVKILDTGGPHTQPAPKPQLEKAMPEKTGSRVQLAPSVAQKTMVSMTEATRFDKALDDIVEVQSVISYASTRFDINGDDVKLPAPPTAASKGTEFLCPYCGIVCPERHGKGRAWKAHILRDLQPYICTYEDCDDGQRIFNSRTAWLEHERLGHRRVWQCFEHVEPKFGSKAALQNHLECEHGDEVTAKQVQNLIDLCELSIMDTRTTCPFCLLEGPFPGELEDHIALHMHRIATFAIPGGASSDEDKDGLYGIEKQSNCAQDLGSRSSLVSGSLEFNSQLASNPASDTDNPPEAVPERSLFAQILDIKDERDLIKIKHIEDAAFDSDVNCGLRCLPGTCTDVLDQVREWDWGSNKLVLRLESGPGTGKSMIAGTVAQYFDQNGFLGGSFFYRSDRDKHCNFSTLVNTLTVQILKKNPDMIPYVKKEITEQSGLLQKGLEIQFSSFILSPLRRFQGSAVFVFDALNECPMSDVNMMCMFSAMSQLSPPFRVFFTNRYDGTQGFLHRFGLQEIPRGYRFYDDIKERSLDNVRRDNLVFLRDSLNRVRASSGLIMNRPTPQRHGSALDELAYMISTLRIPADTADGLLAWIGTQRFHGSIVCRSIEDKMMYAINNTSCKDLDRLLSDALTELGCPFIPPFYFVLEEYFPDSSFNPST
ncbi:Checkpoint kinase 2 [Orbilia javanica]|uniref:Checkpoint kinase 2 n=1 Tax=Orbilia javanica TaxID=47235 RepID=A0AAN8MIF3_9PEZI